MTANSKVNVGIIGTGVGLRTHLPGFRRTEGAEIIGIVGSNLARSQEFAQKFSIPKAFNNYQTLCEDKDIDLVCVTTPNPFHYEQISYALNCGKHVLAEKPLAMTMPEIVQLCSMAKKSPKITLIDHQLRFNPYIVKVRQLIQNNEIGRPYHIRIHQQSNGFSNREAAWNWSFDEAQGGGVRLAMASHLIDLLWFWLGEVKINHVVGQMDVVVPTRKDLSGTNRSIKVSSFFGIHLSIENEINVHLTATAAALGEAKFDFSVYGTDGEIHFNLADKLTAAFLKERTKIKPISVDSVTSEERENKVSIFSGSFVYLAPKLIDAITHNNRSLIENAAKFDDAVPTQQILDAVLESSTQGSLVRLSTGYKPGAEI